MSHKLWSNRKNIVVTNSKVDYLTCFGTQFEVRNYLLHLCHHFGMFLFLQFFWKFHKSSIFFSEFRKASFQSESLAKSQPEVKRKSSLTFNQLHADAILIAEQSSTNGNIPQELCSRPNSEAVIRVQTLKVLLGFQ